jgi:SAM-dependent methyltransferase
MERRRDSFDAAADNYDRYRLAYPSEVVEDVVTSAGITVGTRVLEIAPGTGQLSVPLAERGAELVAVELGPALAAIARRNLAFYPSARVHNAAFEEWPLPAAPFDAVVCATAFHWLDPAVRFDKSARALRPGGRLVILQGHHVAGGTPGFGEESQQYYLKWGLAEDLSFRPPTAEETPAGYPEVESQQEFDAVERHRFASLRQYTAESYAGLLRTDSLVLTLDEPQRTGFVDDIGALIETHYGGEVARQYIYEVVVAVRSLLRG